MNDGMGRKNKGIRIGRANGIMMATAAVLACLLVFFSLYTMEAFRAMREDTEQYASALQSAMDMQSGSAYLTDRVRTFVVTGKESALREYFEELDITQRRERAIERTRRNLEGTTPARYLQEAMDLSDALISIELHAFRLAIAGYGYAPEAFPAQIRERALSPEELALSPEEQLSLARTLLFDDTYQTYKADIRRSVEDCKTAISDRTLQSQENSVERLRVVLGVQNVLAALVLVLALLIVFFTARLITAPLRHYVEAISEQRAIPESGAYEMRYLARAYNVVFAQTQRSRDLLSYKASHDDLTRLYNRGVFESLRLENAPDRTVILIDVDHFKTVNDTYGHDVGDLVLKKVADALSKNFRSEDYVCRIGGDEFAVVMMRTNKTMRALIEAKLERVFETLRMTNDGLPRVTLSCGVAFGDRDNPVGDCYQDADAAAYTVKNNGLDGVAFHGDRP